MIDLSGLKGTRPPQILGIRVLMAVCSPQAFSDGAAEREKVVLGERFDLLRPQVLDALRKEDHAQYAFQLAEDYLDFRNLASLCHTETVYPPEKNPNAARIQSYIDKFKEAFTTELYQWYIEHGKPPRMWCPFGIRADVGARGATDHVRTGWCLRRIRGQVLR